MSSPQQTQYEKCVKYVATALQQNPLEESALIIQRRNRLLGLDTKLTIPTETTPTRDPRIQRQSLLEQIETIRAGFWTTPLPELKEFLEKLDAKEFPDIQAVVDRLSIVANHRDQLPSLVNQKGFDGDVFTVFREVLVVAPRDSAVAKERLLAQFGKSKVRKRGSRMIRLIEHKLPALYQLESQWLNSLVRQKGQPMVVETSSDRELNSFRLSSIPWWAYLLAVIILRAIGRMVGD